MVMRMDLHAVLQGESDADPADSTMGTPYDTVNFLNFLTAMRKAFAAYNPQLPVVMGVMSVEHRDIVFPGIASIRAQQLALQAPQLYKTDMKVLRALMTDRVWS